MRIIAGKAKGKKLLVPSPEITRPTADRAKEALFGILESRFIAEGRSFAEINFLDAFAGSGAIGLEALSRGAKYVVFAEKNPEAEACIRKNLTAINGQEKADIYGDVLKLPKAKSAFSVVFLDAPYGKGLIAPALSYLRRAGWIGADTICIAENEAKENFAGAEGFIITDVRKYGRASFIFLKIADDEDKK